MLIIYTDGNNWVNDFIDESKLPRRYIVSSKLIYRDRFFNNSFAFIQDIYLIYKMYIDNFHIKYSFLN